MTDPWKFSRSPALPAFLLVAALVLLTVTPAAATLAVTGQSFAPVPPLAPGDVQHTAVAVTVLPTGETTFVRTHTLQMQTGLSDARWDIRVIVDGRPAAQQSASGSSAFINGYLLSYPVTSDVSFTVTLNGTVPSPAGSEVTLLQVTELDTSGKLVPGSSLAVAVPATTPSAAETALPSGTSSVTGAAPSPTPRAGYPPAGCLWAVVAAIGACGYARFRS